MNILSGWAWFKSHVLPATKFDLEKAVKTIMASQKSLADDLKLVLDQQKKTLSEIVTVQTEVTTLHDKITALEAVIANGDSASQELIDAVAAVKAQAQVIDDQIPDQPTPPVTPTP